MLHRTWLWTFPLATFPELVDRDHEERWLPAALTPINTHTFFYIPWCSGHRSSHSALRGIVPTHTQLCLLVPSLCYPTSIPTASTRSSPHSHSRTFHSYAPGTYKNPPVRVCSSCSSGSDQMSGLKLFRGRWSVTTSYQLPVSSCVMGRPPSCQWPFCSCSYFRVSRGPWCLLFLHIFPRGIWSSCVCLVSFIRQPKDAQHRRQLIAILQGFSSQTQHSKKSEISGGCKALAGWKVDFSYPGGR